MEPFTENKLKFLLSASALSINNYRETYRHNLRLASLDLSSRISWDIISIPEQEHSEIVRSTLLQFDQSIMEPFTATEFMLSLSRSPLNKNNYRRTYRHNSSIASLDLNIRNTWNINSNPKQELSEIVRRTLLQLDQSAYNDFTDNHLNSFYEPFLNCLYRSVGGRSRQVDDDKLISCLHWQLRNVTPKDNTRNTLRRYLTFLSKNIMNFPEDRKSSIFDEVSTVLYRLSYEESSLSYLLIKGTSFELELPCSIFILDTQPRRLNYILHQMQAYCNEIRRPDIFRLMKNRNSIIRCLMDGRPDFLKVVLKYGNWKSHLRKNIFSEIAKYFNYQVPNFNIDDYITFRRFLAAQVYNMFRRFHAARVNFTVRSAYDISERYLSTLLLWWKSLPYPYIKADEMEIALKDYQIDCSPIVIRSYRNRLCPGILQPRSLRHQTRCAIRSFIDENSLLPRGIDTLNVPRILRNYLKLKEPESQIDGVQVDEVQMAAAQVDEDPMDAAQIDDDPMDAAQVDEDPMDAAQMNEDLMEE